MVSIIASAACVDEDGGELGDVVLAHVLAERLDVACVYDELVCAAPHPQLTSQYAYLMESEDLLTLYWLNPTAFGGGGFFSLTCSAEPSVLPFEERLVNFSC